MTKTLTRTLVATAIAVLGGHSASAQTPAAGVPAALAVDAALAAIAACKANGYAVTVTIMDADMSTRIVLRSDGARDMTVEIGRRKAYTVLKTGMTSGEFGKTVPAPPSSGPPPPGPPKMPGPVNGDPNLITFAGGLPIKAGHETIGSISVSGAPGGEKDEVCANAGLTKIADKLK